MHDRAEPEGVFELAGAGVVVGGVHHATRHAGGSLNTINAPTIATTASLGGTLCLSSCLNDATAARALRALAMSAKRR